jgi:hypothetical protein
MVTTSEMLSGSRKGIGFGEVASPSRSIRMTPPTPSPTHPNPLPRPPEGGKGRPLPGSLRPSEMATLVRTLEVWCSQLRPSLVAFHAVLGGAAGDVTLQGGNVPGDGRPWREALRARQRTFGVLCHPGEARSAGEGHLPKVRPARAGSRRGRPAPGWRRPGPTTSLSQTDLRAPVPGRDPLRPAGAARALPRHTKEALAARERDTA